MSIELKNTAAAVEELKTCPDGFGLRLKLNLKTGEVITSSETGNNSSSLVWSELEPWQIDLGFHTAAEITSQADLFSLVAQKIAQEARQAAAGDPRRFEYLQNYI